ncbi:MAG: porphobilinogen synthase [Synergistaceae bacterium]|nr:porphobilinogen synthase [Synergistaceae bacterium]
MIIRPRRLRRTQAIRDMVSETRLSPSMLVYPIFVREGRNVVEDIPAMPGQKRWSPDTVARILEQAAKAGIGGVLFFGVPDHKDEEGSGAWAENGVVQQAMRVSKKEFPNLTVIGDVCLCEYTSHGHCGVLKGEGAARTVDNDPTLTLLSRAAVSQARAGADIVAPSDMMDGRVGAIRAALDSAGLQDTLIFSYAVKYASAFYGPFREAAGSAPSFGDRRSYQMDPRNVREALKEAQMDMDEGADMIMVKPGLPYLDVLRAVKEHTRVPVGSYSVSGEYAMIKAAAEKGWLDEERVVSEAAICQARAGADILINYFALSLAAWMREGKVMIQ